MKNLKKAILMILCLSMLVSCALAGCKKNEETSTDTTDTSVQGSPETTDAPADEQGTLIIYPEFDERIKRDYMYSVSVTQGETTARLPVYNHTVASRVTRSTVDTTADEYRRFSTFAFDSAGGGVRVDIKVNCDFKSYSVIPSAKNFKNKFSNGVISVYLDKPDYFMIRLNGKDSTLIAVLADAPETDIPTAGVNTTIIDGWYEEEDGVLELNKDGSVVYIKPGAVLNARIHVAADNCKIIGRGAILDPFSDIYRYDEKDIDKAGLIRVYNSDNTVIDGVHMLNSLTFNIFSQGIWDRTYTKNSRITNIKILSSQLSSDGIAIGYWNKDANIEHCFIYCGDNAVLYEDGAHFKDILVGTTCNSIYPQTDVRNSSCEDIYVFRSDENIINLEMGGSGGQTAIDNHTVTNLYAQDVTYTGAFLRVDNTNPVVSSNGGTTLKNVYLPKIDGVKAIFYQNTAKGNHEVNLINVSVDGKLVTSITPTLNGGQYSTYVFADEKWGWMSYPNGHEFSYTTTSDFDPNIKKHSATVNYKNDLNVFVGAYNVFFEFPVVKEGSDILLPFEQTQYELRTDKSASVVEKDGVKYVSANDLVSSGMAKEVKTEGNNLVITPNYNGENLILPDTGIQSQFTEMVAGHMEITAVKEGNTTVIHITRNTNSSTVVGINCLINEAIKKYGTGNYRLTFDAKSTEAEQITATIGYGAESMVHKSTTVAVGTDWTACSLDFGIRTLQLNQSQIRFGITGVWADVAEFDVKNICLVKVS